MSAPAENTDTVGEVPATFRAWLFGHGRPRPWNWRNALVEFCFTAGFAGASVIVWFQLIKLWGDAGFDPLNSGILMTIPAMIAINRSFFAVRPATLKFRLLTGLAGMFAGALLQTAFAAGMAMAAAYAEGPFWMIVMALGLSLLFALPAFLAGSLLSWRVAIRQAREIGREGDTH